MIPTKAFTIHTKALVVGLLIGSISVYLLASAIAVYRAHGAIATLDEKIFEYETDLMKTVVAIHGTETTGVQNGLRDCTTEERVEFDRLLSDLEDGLLAAELELLSKLFDRCAAYSAERREQLTQHLETKIDSLKVLLDMRGILSHDGVGLAKIQKYQELLSAEKEVNQKLFDLVDLQGEIIQALKDGLSVTSKEADMLREKGGRIQSEITFQTEIINLLRQELIVD